VDKRHEMVTFGYDRCAESWTARWVGPDGSSYRCGELRVVKEQAVGSGHVANAPRKGREGAKGRERGGHKNNIL